MADTNLKGLIKNCILNELNEPLLLERFLYQIEEKWKCLYWNINEWSNIFGDESYRIQFGKRISSSEVRDSPQWEHTNLKGYMNFNELLQWNRGEKKFTTTCNTQVSQSEYWAYLDYLHMKDIPSLELLDKSLSWECFGLPEIGAKESTIWIGTPGANTPCHIDTYGVNIVCQISGEKRWTLFSKEQTPYLYPTRVPYEESSIYSEVGFPRPNIKKFTKLMQTTPFVITLKEGDVLLVPKHWWHFVENLELSISINTWLPLSSDSNDRLKEALILYQIGSLCQSVSNLTLLRSIFNDNMTTQASMNSEELLHSLKLNISNYLAEKKSNTQLTSSSSVKKLKRDNELNTSNPPPSSSHIFQNIKRFSFKDYCALINIEYDAVNDQHTRDKLDLESNYIKFLINSLTDDRVISTLKMVLEENLRQFS